MKKKLKSKTLGNIKLVKISDGKYKASTDAVIDNDNGETQIELFSDAKTFTRKSMKKRCIGTNWYLNQLTDLYWIHRKGDNDVHIQGYVGIKPAYQENDKENRWITEIQLLLKNGYVNSDELEDIVFEVINTGTKSNMSIEEIKLRSQMGIGWNYAVGGNCVNGVLGDCKAWLPWYEKAIAENPNLKID